MSQSVLKNLANSIASKEKSKPNALKKLPSGTFSISNNTEADKEFFNLDLNEKSQQSLTRGNDCNKISKDFLINPHPQSLTDWHLCASVKCESLFGEKDSVNNK